jgi:hypothetical protein
MLHTRDFASDYINVSVGPEDDPAESKHVALVISFIVNEIYIV